MICFASTSPLVTIWVGAPEGSPNDGGNENPAPVSVSEATGDSTVTTIVRSAGARSGSEARKASTATSEPSVQSNTMESMGQVWQGMLATSACSTSVVPGENFDRVQPPPGISEVDVGTVRPVIHPTRPRVRTYPLLLAGAVLLAACGSDSTSSDTTGPADSVVSTDEASADTAAQAPVERPPIETLPSVPVTELGVTVVEAGDGPAAAEGDTVVVDYTGVRSADGTEFDNSYDFGEPLTVGPLGGSGTIEGWDQGLIGVQAGETVQLDVPSALAYGDQAQGEIIQAGDDLTFLIEVRAVIAGTTADQAPDVTVEPTSGATEVGVTDLVDGTGAEAVAGSTVAVQYLAFSGADGSQVDSGWDYGVPLVLTLGSDRYLQGFEEGITGMKVGGRRQVVIPGELAFGAEGNEGLGMPAGADLIMVFDLVAVF